MERIDDKGELSDVRFVLINFSITLPPLLFIGQG